MSRRADRPGGGADGGKSRRSARLLLGWVGLCVVALAITTASRPWPRLWPRFANNLLVDELGGVGYVAVDAFQSATWRWQEARQTAVDPALYRAYLAELAAERRPVPAGAAPRKHVVFLQLESVDGLVLGARHEGRPLMPFLESLAREQVYFSNVIDNTAGGRTTDAEVLVLTSQVPLRRRPVFVSQPLDRVPSLPKALKAAGYHCWSMHGYDGHFWHRKRAHQALGYDETLFREQLDVGEQIGWGISDRSVLHQAALKLQVATQPNFAHVILLTNHHPYQHVGLRRGTPGGRIEADYVQSVGYVDESLAAFFAELEAAGLRDKCIVAIYSDHDSAMTHALERYLEEVPARLHYDTVPLIVAGLPEAPRRYEAAAGLQNLPVIVLEALGLTVPRTFTGHGLDHIGRTVAAYYGPLETTPEGLRTYELPIDPQTLTLLALHKPEVLLEP